MKFVPAAFENEVLTDATPRTDMSKAKSRMELIVQSTSEHTVGCYNPNATPKSPAYYED